MKNLYYFKNEINLGIENIISYYLNFSDDILINNINEDFSNIIDDELSYLLFSIRTTKEYQKLFGYIDLMRNLYSFKFKIIIGGGAVDTIDLSELLQFFPEINFIVIGRGEEVFKEIITNNLLPGIYYDNDFKNIEYYVSNKIFLNNKNEIIISFDGNDCAWDRCDFCQLSNNEKYKNSIETILNKIIYYTSNNIKRFFIIDNYLNINKFIKLLNLLLDNNISNIEFEISGIHIQSNIKLLKPFINKFKFINMGFGVEFLDDEILKLYNKGITVSQIENSINICYDLGINYSTFLLFGLPLVKQINIDNFYKNLEKLDSKIFNYRISYFNLNEKIKMFNNLEKFKVRLLDKKCIEYNNLKIKTCNFNFESFNDDYNCYFDEQSTINLYPLYPWMLKHAFGDSKFNEIVGR